MSESEKKVYTSDFPIINVCVDLALFRVNPDDHFEHEVLMIERANNPFKGNLALPGGFLEYDEHPRDGALREAKEETGIEPTHIKFVTMLDAPDRDPRGRVISYLFAGWMPPENSEPVAGDDAATAAWVPLRVAKRAVKAFDHDSALTMAWEALK